MPDPRGRPAGRSDRQGCPTGTLIGMAGLGRGSYLVYSRRCVCLWRARVKQRGQATPAGKGGGRDAKYMRYKIMSLIDPMTTGIGVYVEPILMERPAISIVETFDDQIPSGHCFDWHESINSALVYQPFVDCFGADAAASAAPAQRPRSAAARQGPARTAASAGGIYVRGMSVRRMDRPVLSRLTAAGWWTSTVCRSRRRTRRGGGGPGAGRNDTGQGWSGQAAASVEGTPLRSGEQFIFLPGVFKGAVSTAGRPKRDKGPDMHVPAQ